jgi:hypothetical protein
VLRLVAGWRVLRLRASHPSGQRTPAGDPGARFAQDDNLWGRQEQLQEQLQLQLQLQLQEQLQGFFTSFRMTEFVLCLELFFVQNDGILFVQNDGILFVQRDEFGR